MNGGEPWGPCSGQAETIVGHRWESRTSTINWLVARQHFGKARKVPSLSFAQRCGSLSSVAAQPRRRRNLDGGKHSSIVCLVRAHWRPEVATDEICGSSIVASILFSSRRPGSGGDTLYEKLGTFRALNAQSDLSRPILPRLFDESHSRSGGCAAGRANKAKPHAAEQG